MLNWIKEWRKSLAHLVLKAQSQEMRRLHCSFIFFFLIQDWNKNLFLQIFQRERVWSSKKSAQSGVWKRPSLGSCCESCNGYHLPSLILKSFCSFWVLSSNSPLRTFTLEPDTHQQRNFSLIHLSINRINCRLTYLMIEAVPWNVQELHFSFSFRLVTQGPSNVLHLQEFPSHHARISLSPCKNFLLPIQGPLFMQ